MICCCCCYYYYDCFALCVMCNPFMVGFLLCIFISYFFRCFFFFTSLHLLYIRPQSRPFFCNYFYIFFSQFFYCVVFLLYTFAFFLWMLMGFFLLSKCLVLFALRCCFLCLETFFFALSIQ